MHFRAGSTFRDYAAGKSLESHGVWKHASCNQSVANDMARQNGGDLDTKLSRASARVYNVDRVFGNGYQRGLPSTVYKPSN